MQYTIISYRSRNITSRVYSYLVNNGFKASIVSTPRAVGIGCGLSIRMNIDDIRRSGIAKIDSYAGVYTITNQAGRTTATLVSI